MNQLVTLHTQSLRGPIVPDYLDKLATALRTARLNNTYPDRRRVQGSLDAMKLAMEGGLYEQLYLDAGYRGRHVPHGWRASFSTIMNERAAVDGREGDRAIIDLMLAHVKGDVEAAYNRASYMPRRREIAQTWADLLLKDAAGPAGLVKEKRRKS